MNLKAFSIGGMLVISLFTGISTRAQLPPTRSTVFPANYSGHVQFPARAYITAAPMTIEAWVYREDATRCETILSQDYTQSFWLGFCANTLRFYRSGSAADAGVNVPERRWTHVAASYSAGEVRFYIDGALVATRALTGSASGAARPLYLGSDPGGYRFHGALDEVRLWSVARSGNQIRENRFAEVHSGEGLVAAFPAGGGRDAVSGATASMPSVVKGQVTGILPRDLVVPRTLRTILRNGSPNLEEFEGAEKMVVRYVDGGKEFDAVASLILAKDGASTVTNLWIGITFPELETSFGFNGGMVRAYFDRDGSGDAAPGNEDLRFTYSAYAETPEKAGYRGAGGGGWAEDSALTSSSIFQATSGFCAGEFAPQCIEMGIYESWARSGSDVGEIRFMLDLFKAGFGLIIPPVFRPAPFDANPGSPATWPKMRFGGYANVPASEVSVRAFVYERLPGGGEEPMGNVRVRVMDNRNLNELDRDFTWASGGDAAFWLTVPDTVPLRLEVDAPAGWIPVTQRISGLGGIEPVTVGERHAIYPTCGEDFCRYADVFFVFERPPGPVSFGAPVEPRYTPGIAIRGGLRRRAFHPRK